MATFSAAYHGECGHGDRIVPGDQVVYDADGELVHVACEQLGITEQPCPDCHLVHAGGCF